MRLKFLSFSNLTLLVALLLSSVAAWYSIIGLTAIFAGAVVPVIIMGSILEIGKITTTVWLRKYWGRAGIALKLYLVPAVIALALLTSMGIFGFLSKAHMEHGINTGDSQAKVSLYDEKIRTQRENIELSRKALTQMDSQVDQRLSRGDSENSAERAVAIRRQQAGERSKLQKEIGDAQKEITKLNEERAPIAAENRKVEAEIGPIKYIAALIYGDNADQNTLESAVRWVIILLVIVFDPLAIALVLAANASKEWDDEEPVKDETTYDPDDGSINEEALELLRERAKEELPIGEMTTKSELFPSDPTINCHKCDTALMNASGIGLYCPNKACDVADGPFVEPEPEKSLLEQHPYLLKGFDHFEGLKPLVYNPPQTTEEDTEDGTEEEKQAQREWKRQNPGATVKSQRTLLEQGRIEQLPWLGLIADNDTGFGPEFPPQAKKGDTWVKTDSLPTCLFKFNGSRWIDIDKATTDSYTYNTAYIDHLINKISSGEYDPDLLSDAEREQVEQRLQTKT
jgi:hypothetical protein